MSTLTENLQAACRAITGTSGTFNEDLGAFFSQQNIPAGQFDERMLRYGRSQDTSITTAAGALNFLLNNPPVNLFPDPSLTNETGYTLGGDMIKLPGLLRLGPGGFGFCTASTTGALEVSTLAALANSTVFQVSICVANFINDNLNLEISLKGGLSVALAPATNGWSTPVNVTSGASTPGLFIGDNSGTVQLDIIDICILA